MHDNEIYLTEKDVGLLLQQQFPQFADLELSYIQESGTEKALYRLGDEYIVLLPRFVSDIDDMSRLSKAKRLTYEKVQPKFWAYAGEKGAIQVIVVCGYHDKLKAKFLNENKLNIVSDWYLGEIDDEK
jgi:hypothetical protein